MYLKIFYLKKLFCISKVTNIIATSLCECTSKDTVTEWTTLNTTSYNFPTKWIPMRNIQF